MLSPSYAIPSSLILSAPSPGCFLSLGEGDIEILFMSDAPLCTDL